LLLRFGGVDARATSPSRRPGEFLFAQYQLAGRGTPSVDSEQSESNLKVLGAGGLRVSSTTKAIRPCSVHTGSRHHGDDVRGDAQPDLAAVREFTGMTRGKSMNFCAAAHGVHPSARRQGQPATTDANPGGSIIVESGARFQKLRFYRKREWERHDSGRIDRYPRDPMKLTTV